jgi:hypothetical protein
MICVFKRTWKLWMHLFLGLCCLLAISEVANARGSDLGRGTGKKQAQNSRATIPDSQFAIGDFDGDRQPDLATVEIARFNTLRSRYWVSFQLSRGRLQTIGVTGPGGGLVLLAQDVNGDRALDLVLVTAWRHELVAVLLNDGEGNFSAADPAQFPIEAVSSRTQLGIASRLLGDRTILGFEYSTLWGPGRKIAVAQESRPALWRALGFARTLFRSSPSGRAPPRPFLHV